MWEEQESSLSLIAKKIEFLSNDEKINLLKNLFKTTVLPHTTCLWIESMLHKNCSHNSPCHDFVSWLPNEVLSKIFSYLDPISLCHSSMVNKSWYQLVSDQRLWYNLCQQTKWKVSESPKRGLVSTSNLSETSKDVAFISETEHQIIEDEDDSVFLQDENVFIDFNKFTHHPDNGPINWQEEFKRRYILRKNWNHGRLKSKRFNGHNYAVYCIAIGAGRIVSGSADATICVWNAKTNAGWSKQILRGHSKPVRSLVLLPIETKFDGPDVTEGKSRINRCLSMRDPVTSSGDMESKKSRNYSFSGVSNSENISSKAIASSIPGQCLLISGSCDSTIRVWRLYTTENWSRIACLASFVGHTDTVSCLQADSEKVISGSYDATIRQYCLQTMTQMKVFKGHSLGIVHLYYEDEYLFSGSLDATIRIWNLETTDCLHVLTTELSPPLAPWLNKVSCFYINKKSDELLVSFFNGRIYHWSLKNLKKENLDKASLVMKKHKVLSERRNQNAITDPSKAVFNITTLRCLAGNQNHLLVATDDAKIEVWEIDCDSSNEPVYRFLYYLKGHEDGVTCLALSEDGKSVVSGSYDMSIILHDFDICQT